MRRPWPRRLRVSDHMTNRLRSSCIVSALVAIALASACIPELCGPNCTGQPAGRDRASTVYVADYGTSASSIQRAAYAARGKTLIFPYGSTYVMTSGVSLPSNITVVGNESVLKTPDNSTTAGTSDGIFDIIDQSNVDISGLVFDGNVDRQKAWSQSRHEVRILGSSHNVNVQHCVYRNLIGDGIYVGSGKPLGVTITKSTFNGAHANRNGVSVVSASSVRIDHNTFTNMARPDMPGAVDLEPNTASDQLEGIMVTDNTVRTGSAVAGRGLRRGMTFNNQADAEAHSIVFSENDVSGSYLSGAGIAIINQPTPSRITDIRATGNNVHDLDVGSSGIELSDGVRVSVTNNQLRNVGFGVRSYHACLLDSTGNHFTNTHRAAVVVVASSC